MNQFLRFEGVPTFIIAARVVPEITGNASRGEQPSGSSPWDP